MLNFNFFALANETKTIIIYSRWLYLKINYAKYFLFVYEIPTLVNMNIYYAVNKIK